MTTIMHDPSEPLPNANLRALPRAHVFIATTVYEKPSAEYTFALAKTRHYLHSQGILNDYYLLHANCHVDDARNQAVADFLASEADLLLFIDADVSWEPHQILRLIEHERAIVGGVYPLRGLGQAANAPCVTIEGEVPDDDGLLEVEGLPTGFIMITREAIELMIERDPDNGYHKSELDDQWMPLLFERTLEDGKRYGGDISFCRKWRSMGGRVYADMEMRLGHAGQMIKRGSLGQAHRLRTGTTLRWIASRLAHNVPKLDWLTEARQYVDNGWGAPETLLATACAASREVPKGGDIIECGSGLTTVLMAASNPDITIWCLEHDPLYVQQTKRLCEEAGVTNVAIIASELVEGFYNLTPQDMEALPQVFHAALVDGPPRDLGSRNRFFEILGSRCLKIVCDDADDPVVNEGLSSWAEEVGYDRQSVAGDRTVILTRMPRQGAVA